VAEYPRIANDREVSRWLLRMPFPYRRKDAEQFVAAAAESYRDGTRLALAVIRRESDELMGGFGLNTINWAHRHAELGYWLGRPFWGQGYGREAIEEMLRVCFVSLRLHRVEASTYAGNDRSQGLLQKVGFLPEGVRREVFWQQQRWKDDVVFGLTVDDWRRHRSNQLRSPVGRR
jgi:RimJ/RimL family protein N-acetyltransferase